MRLRTLSVLGLFGVLQRHGLSEAMLRTWVEACERQHTGQVTVQLTQGRMRSLETTAISTRRPRLAHD
jgi:hypothetical protein